MGANVLQLYANGLPNSDELTKTCGYVFKLFISGKSPRTEFTIEMLRLNLDKGLEGRYELTVHDVLEEPQLAEDEKILATPTLVRISPLPARRVIGDLSAIQSIFNYLSLPFGCLGNGKKPDRP